jgi:hypothetical protein
MSPALLCGRDQDHARWLAWVASRNARSKSRSNSSGPPLGPGSSSMPNRHQHNG